MNIDELEGSGRLVQSSELISVSIDDGVMEDWYRVVS